MASITDIVTAVGNNPTLNGHELSFGWFEEDFYFIDAASPSLTGTLEFDNGYAVIVGGLLVAESCWRLVKTGHVHRKALFIPARNPSNNVISL
jgi:hypothetical protein